MNNLYNVFPDEDKASIVFFERLVNIEQFEPFSFKGKNQPDWKPVKFKWHSKDDKYRNNNDFIIVHNGVGVGVVLSEKAKEILEPVFKKDAEYLPIEIDGETKTFYILNVLNVVKDAIDLDKSEFRVLKNGNKGSIKKSVFNANNIPDNRIFVYPEHLFSTALIKGELLKETCEKHGLTGLSFKPMKNIT